MKTLLHYLGILCLSTALLTLGCLKKNQNTASSAFFENFQSNQTFTHSAYGLKATYKGRLQNNMLHINIKIDTEKDKPLLNEYLHINTQTEYLGSDISALITEKSQKIAPQTDLRTITRIAYLLDNMLEKFSANTPSEIVTKLESQGLFISTSLIKATQRKLKSQAKQYASFLKNIPFPTIYSASFLTLQHPPNTNPLPNTALTPTPLTTTLSKEKQAFLSYFVEEIPLTTNTVYEGFNRGLSSFILNEDIHLNVQNFIQFSNENAQLAKEKGGDYLMPVLANFHKPVVSLQELLIAFRDYYKADLQKAFNAARERGEVEGEFPDDIDELGRKGCKWYHIFGHGSWGKELGCCGNYDKCCWYWHPLCWIHDAMCPQCGQNNPFGQVGKFAGKIFCLPKCVPDNPRPNRPSYPRRGGDNDPIWPQEPCPECEIDCDIYYSTKYQLEDLEKTIATGATIDTDFLQYIDNNEFEHFVNLCAPASKKDDLLFLYYKYKKGRFIVPEKPPKF